jgi:hypothetical protein
MSCTATPIATPFRFTDGHAIGRVTYEPGFLAVHVEGAPDDPTVVVAFEKVRAFRVTDEGNLLAFWPTCSRANGWIFEVHERGWRSEESARPGTIIGAMNPGLREFLVTGECDCVSVLSLASPTVALLRG